MAVSDLSQRIIELTQRIEDLQQHCISDPANAAEVLSDALENLQISLEELSAADEELMQQNDQLIEAQEELRETRDYLENLIDHANAPIIVWDTSVRITRFNHAFERLTGLNAVEVLTKSLDILFPKESKNKSLECIRRTLSGERWEAVEIPILRSDGSIRTVLWNSANVYDKDGTTVVATIAQGQDITERKQAEEKLKESEQRFRDAIDHFPNVFMIYDADRRVQFVNSKGLQIIGRSEQEVIGKRDEEIFPPEMINSYLPTLKRAVETQMPQMLERTRSASMGGQAIIINIVPLLNEIGNVRQILGITYDITEHRRIEEELRRARNELELRVQERTAELQKAKEELEIINEELQVEIAEHEKTEKDLLKAKEAAEDAVNAKAAFLANMSHELRTPMNSVIGFTGLLLDENLTQEQKDDVKSIRNSGEALLAIINDILEFSRAEKEKVKLDHQPLSLKHCVEESLDMVAVQANQKGLNMAHTINYGTPDMIIGDHGRLRQILVNLLSNSVKFTDEGEVSVSISSKAIENNKHQILFTVRDTGIGIPQDKIDRLFQPFAQLEYVISRKRDGVGLGLAISKKLVELMGGKIWAESVPGQGTTFRFTIQVETTPGEHLDLVVTDRDAAYKSLSGQMPLAILVAEDNPSNQKVLMKMLKRMGYRADAVADGCEVLKALELRHYDLVLMDVRMPEMDGITATKDIRKHWPNKGPKIIAITAYALEGDREKCLEAGMDDYISKPVQMRELQAVLMKYLVPSGEPN